MAASLQYRPIPAPAGQATRHGTVSGGWNQGVRLEALANLAHELRTPVQVLLGYLEILREDLAEEVGVQARDVVERMNANVHDLAQTVENVMEFATAASGAEARTHEVFRLRDLLDELTPALEAANRNKNLEIELALSGAPETVGCARKPLRTILANLASNAIKFTGSGKVVISLAEGRAANGGETLVLEVTDTGPGMDPELLGVAFESLKQLSGSSVRRFRGLGLGLAVVHQSVSALGGELAVQTAPGQGASFRVTVPCRIVRRISPSKAFGRKFQGAAAIAGARQTAAGGKATGRRIHHS